MSESCKNFRREWLFSSDVSEHAESCKACRAFMAASQARIGALESLTMAPAPLELEARVEEELSGTGTRRMTSVLTSLVRHPAPATLDVLMRRRLVEHGDPSRGQERARAVAALDIRGAPDVLERLLREELEDPAGARADRFVGTVTRLEAPSSLADRLAVGLRRRATLRTIVPPIASLAAAALVVWLVVRGVEPNDRPRRPYSFEVVRTADLGGLEPVARQMGLLLGGLEGTEER